MVITGCKQSYELETSQDSLISEFLSIDLRISAKRLSIWVPETSCLMEVCPLFMTMSRFCKAKFLFCFTTIRLVLWSKQGHSLAWGFRPALRASLCLVCFRTWLYAFTAHSVISSKFCSTCWTAIPGCSSHSPPWSFLLLISTQMSSSFMFASQRSSAPPSTFFLALNSHISVLTNLYVASEGACPLETLYGLQSLCLGSPLERLQNQSHSVSVGAVLVPPALMGWRRRKYYVL